MIGNAHKTLRRLGLVAALACFAVPAAGAPPPNDDFDNALPVDALPFQDTQDFSEATGASDDPYSTCGLYVAYTAWYSFTPSTDVLVDAYASFVSSVHVYTGSRGNLTQVACGEYQGTVRFQASAGTTYYILVSDAPYSTPPVWVTFSLQEVPPPPPPPVNDEIANATVVSGLPFSETTNVLSATVSNGDNTCGAYATGTVWYSFTPAQNIRVEVTASNWMLFPSVSVSTGSPGQLVLLACGGPGGALGARVRFDAVAGTTYWVMVAAANFGPFGTGPLVVSFAEAPPPFSLGVTADRGSVVPKTGQATLTGTVTCNEPSFVTVSGSLRQERAGMAIEGWFWTNVYCEGAGRAAWSATPYYGLGLFRGRSAFLFTGGRAEARVKAYGNGMTTGDYDEESFVSSLHLTGAE